MASKVRTNAFFSLRTQLVLGAIILLALTVGSIAYVLLRHEENILEEEMERTIILQGRNTALSAERALLRPDPEFELFPLVKRILSENGNITSVVITDREGNIQGHSELRDLSTAFVWDVASYTGRQNAFMQVGERLYYSRYDYRFVTPVQSRDQIIGHVYVDYSRQGFHEAFARAVNITLIIGTGAFALGIVLSLLLFQRISRPMDVLMRGVERLGEGHLDTTINLTVRNEFRVLAESFNTMAARMARAQDELVIKERMDRELEIAHDIQKTLIPAATFEAEGLEIGTHYNAAAQVGGDYLDIIPMDRRHVAFVMADVSGKGVPGLVVMAMLKIMVRALVGKNVSPQEVIRRLNISVAEHIREKMFVTFFLAYVDLDTGRVVYSNAGHNPLMIYRSKSGACELRKMGGPLMGVFKDNDYAPSLEEYETTLEPGDLLLQYTDGLNESTNDRGELFEFSRILEIGNAVAAQGARALVRRLAEAEREFRGSAAQADDITLLALSVKASGRVPAQSASQER